MRMDHGNLVVEKKAAETLQLSQYVRIVETSQSEFRNIIDSQLCHSLQKHAVALEGGNRYVVPAVGQEQTRKLHGLSFRAALMKASDQL